MCHLNFKKEVRTFCASHHFNCIGWKCLPAKVNYLRKWWRVFLLWERQMLERLTSAKCQLTFQMGGSEVSLRSVYWSLLLRTVCGLQLTPHVNVCTWLFCAKRTLYYRWDAVLHVLWVLVELRVRAPETDFSSSCSLLGIWGVHCDLCIYWRGKHTMFLVFSSHTSSSAVNCICSVCKQDVVLRYHRFLDKQCFYLLRAAWPSCFVFHLYQFIVASRLLEEENESICLQSFVAFLKRNSV